MSQASANPPRPSRRSARLWALAGAGLALYAIVLRRRMNRWGATQDEARSWLPGDNLHPDRRLVSTRAVTIDAPAEDIWPWLVQMGHGRAGFYSHDWVERLMGVRYADGHSATRIHPEFQDLKVGDTVPYHDLNHVPVEALDYPRLLIAGEWFVLRPIDGRRTRLIVRTRGGWVEPLVRDVPLVGRVLAPLAGLIDRGPGELLHSYMETGMLTGIKRRVEAASRDRPRRRSEATPASSPVTRQ